VCADCCGESSLTSLQRSNSLCGTCRPARPGTARPSRIGIGATAVIESTRSCQASTNCRSPTHPCWPRGPVRTEHRLPSPPHRHGLAGGPDACPARAPGKSTRFMGFLRAAMCGVRMSCNSVRMAFGVLIVDNNRLFLGAARSAGTGGPYASSALPLPQQRRCSEHGSCGRRSSWPTSRWGVRAGSTWLGGWPDTTGAAARR
jgi:hypothetical protein